MLVLYIVLVLSTLALLGTAAAIYAHVRRHMRETAAARDESAKAAGASEAPKPVGRESKS
jgi:hypothetical protein